jgi:hypothetical protein
VGVHFHWIPAFMTKLPPSVITAMSPHVLAFIHFLEVQFSPMFTCEIY